MFVIEEKIHLLINGQAQQQKNRKHFLFYEEKSLVGLTPDKEKLWSSGERIRVMIVILFEWLHRKNQVKTTSE